MKKSAKHPGTSTGTNDVTLLASVEMGSTGWLLTMRVKGGKKLYRARVNANDWREAGEVLKRQAGQLGCDRIVCCYEAGREGFFPYRALKSLGIEMRMLDPASIAVNQRGRRMKTDRIDGELLVEALEGLLDGRRTAAREVVVPDPGVEDARQLARTRERLVKERTSLVAQIGSHLLRAGVFLPAPTQVGWKEKLSQARQWDGSALPAELLRVIEFAVQRLDLVQQQLAAVEGQQQAAMVAQRLGDGRIRHRRTVRAAQSWTAQADDAQQQLAEAAHRLERLVGIGTKSAWLLSGELFSWRHFRGRRQVGGYLGMGGTVYASGATRREMGISKAGNPRARSMMTELAWLWTGHQPDSALTRWFHARAPKGCPPRVRRTAIVAVARKLAVALWRYVTQGVVPQGAIMAS